MIAPRFVFPLACLAGIVGFFAVAGMQVSMLVDRWKDDAEQAKVAYGVGANPVSLSSVVWTNSSAKLVSFKSNGREIYYQSTDGVWHLPGSLAVQK